MVTAILTHEVKNYSEWKKVYDADEVNRKKAGVNIKSIFSSVDNPNMVTLIGEAPSVEDFKKFMSNPDLKAAMEKGGVMGKPEVKILNKI